MSNLRRIVSLIILVPFSIMIPSLSAHAQEPPQIKDIAPREAQCGTEVTLAIFGANFRKGLEVFIPEGVETIYTEMINPGELQARIRIAENIPSGPRDIELIDLANGRRVVVVERGFNIICEKPLPEALPDLVLFDAYWEFALDGNVLQIISRIINESEAPSRETVIYSQSVTVSRWAAEARVPALQGGDGVTVTLELGIPDEFRGTEHRFHIVVNPGNEILESSNVNNQFDLAIQIPERPEPEIPGEPVPDGGDDQTGLAILAIILSIVVVAAGVTITIRRSGKIRHRREYQENAKEEKPPETCQPCTRYCQKIKIETELAQRKIAYLSLVAASTGYPKDSRESRIEGKAIERLNNAVDIYRQDNNLQQLEKGVTAVAALMVEHLRQWLASGSAPYDVSITGRLMGGKFKCEFYLYHCKQRGEHSVWEEEDKWKATIKDERDETIATLHALDPSEVELVERFVPSLTHSLVRFIQKV